MEENNRLEKATANGEEAEGVQPTGSQPSQGREVPTQQWEEFNPPKVVSKGVKAKKGVKIAFVCLGYALLALLAVTLVWMLVDKYVKKSPAPGAFG